MVIATKNTSSDFQVFTCHIEMFLILYTKHICSVDDGECSDALFEITRSNDDILWLNIQRRIYGALVPLTVKTTF